MESAPALAAGCTMILKPSKEAPLNAFILADIIMAVASGGVFNLISGHGREIERLFPHILKSIWLVSLALHRLELCLKNRL